MCQLTGHGLGRSVSIGVMLMRRVGAISLLSMFLVSTFLVLVVVAPSEGRGGHAGGHHGRHHGHHGHRGHHGHVIVGVGPWWWGPPYPYWYVPPPVVVEQPLVYIEPPQTTQPAAYWYYCPSAKAYYPQVSSRPEPWIPVPPTTN